MNCKDFQAGLTEWLETTWKIDTEGYGAASAETDVTGALRTHAGTCETCSKRLKRAQAVVGMKDEAIEPPPMLASRICDLLEEKTIGGTPRRPRFSYLSAAALAAALLAVALTTALLFSGRTVGGGDVRIRFSLEAPSANQVHVVGDWNGWDPSADPLLDRNGDGVWEIEIKLAPGKEYRYQFFVDDEEWMADPEAPLSIEDGFGGLNSILRI